MHMLTLIVVASALLAGLTATNRGFAVSPTALNALSAFYAQTHELVHQHYLAYRGSGRRVIVV